MSSSSEERLSEIQRWTGKRKSAVVLDILKGKTTAVNVARKHALTVSELEGWVQTFLEAGEEHLRSNPRDAIAQQEAERRELYPKVGELALTVDALKKTLMTSCRSAQADTI